MTDPHILEPVVLDTIERYFELLQAHALPGGAEAGHRQMPGARRRRRAVPRACHRRWGYRRGRRRRPGGVLAWRWRNRKTSAARVMPSLHQKMARPLRRSSMSGAHLPYPSESAYELPGGLHLYFRGVSVEDIAAIPGR